MIDEIKDAIGREFSTQTPGHIKYKNIIHFLENGIVKELETSRELIATHIKDRRDFKSQNKKLRECVEFYRDEKYLKKATSNNAADGYGVYKFDVDGGKKARECLKELE